jgi:hypothetical protein
VTQVKICSALVQQAALGLGIAFPYPQTSFAGKNTDCVRPFKCEMIILPRQARNKEKGKRFEKTVCAGGTDWHLPDRHSSSLVRDVKT